MADKLITSPIMIQKITLFVALNLWLKRLDMQLSEATNHDSLKSQKMLSQLLRKRYYKTYGD